MARRLVPRSTTVTAKVPWHSWLPRRRYWVAGMVEAADEVPERLPRKALIVVERGGRPSWVAFDCPCSRCHRLLIPLSSRVSPHWRLSDSKRPSLAPSVDSTDGELRCHFWLKNGLIQWAGRQPMTRERAQ